MRTNNFMKKLLRSAAMLFIAAIMITAFPLSALASSDTERDIGSHLSEMILDEYESDLGAWLNGELSEAPELNEWYAMAIMRYLPDTNADVYADKLEAYLRDNTVNSATTRQKYGLALIACGKRSSEHIRGLVDSTLGKQGIMSIVFALNLLTNGAPSDKYVPENVIPMLLKLACKDGGWSLSGDQADVDVTAMTVQALSPYYNLYTEVKTAVDAGIFKLSQLQQADGDYLSYGYTNPESGAQTLIALLSLGLDPLNDTMFIKNGNTLIDGITKYKLEDGRYEHIKGGGANHSATVQAFSAFMAAAHADKKPFYFFKSAQVSLNPLDYTLAEQMENGGLGDGNSEENTQEGGQENTEDGGNSSSRGIGYKLPVSISIVALALISCGILFALKKRNKQNFIIIIAIAALLIAGVWLINISSSEDYYGDIPEKDAPVGSVTVEIRCDEALSDGNDAVILKKTSIQIEEGETVYDILLQVTKQARITVDTSGSSTAGTVYVRGIDGLYEFEKGELSGWTYTVNGERINLGCDFCKLKDGDAVIWLYTDKAFN